ncbi:MAG TPA: hypothetical protein V6D17_00025 [Candidatus Obscuribacterales bacterium]
MEILLILAAFAFAYLCLTSKSRAETRRRFDAAAEADRLMNQAHLNEAARRYDVAESQFLRASGLAKEAKAAFLTSEALYGAARMRMHYSDGAQAARLLEQALALENQWYEPKPHFSGRMRADLERARSLASK